jgi:hypothetical protein
LGAKFHSGGYAAETRQALGSARAGNDAQQHFGLSDFGSGHGHAVVAGHGEFESAAERGAVDGTHDRLGTIFDAPQQRVDAMRAVDGNFAVGDGAEDLDIGAGDECIARADQHDGFDGRVGGGACHARVDAFGHAGAEGVDGRIVDGDDGNVVLDGVWDEFWHDSIHYATGGGRGRGGDLVLQFAALLVNASKSDLHWFCSHRRRPMTTMRVDSQAGCRALPRP